MTESGWSSLPQDLIYSIIDRLPEFHDFLRFCSVCKTWRSTALLEDHNNTSLTITVHHRNLELLKTYRNRVPMLYEVGGPNLRLYSVNGAIYNDIQTFSPRRSIPHSFGTYNGWLFTVFDIVNDSNLITLVNPLLNKSFHLPPIQYPSFMCPTADYGLFYKALLLPSSPPSKIRVEDRDTYHVVLLYGDRHGGLYSKKLACLKSRDVSWDIFHTGDIGDIICYQDQLYALLGTLVFNIDINTRTYELVVDSPTRLPINRYNRLVESRGGDLLLVSRGFLITRNYRMMMIDKYAKIEVYRMCSASLSWQRVRSIGEEALFLSKLASSFSVSTHEFPMCKPNSIYYDDGYYDISESYDHEVLLDIARKIFVFGGGGADSTSTPSISTRRYYIWTLPYLKT